MPQEAFLGPLLFRILINDLCSVVRYSDCLLFVDGIETFNGTMSYQGSSLHQPDTTQPELSPSLEKTTCLVLIANCVNHLFYIH